MHALQGLMHIRQCQEMKSCWQHPPALCEKNTPLHGCNGCTGPSMHDLHDVACLQSCTTLVAAMQTTWQDLLWDMTCCVDLYLACSFCHHKCLLKHAEGAFRASCCLSRSCMLLPYHQRRLMQIWACLNAVCQHQHRHAGAKLVAKFIS